tara:strand:- start:2220 stop:3428 length:1209 start_codon:yes stop_codon:yes gene_type:complete
MGMVTPLGNNLEDTWSNVKAGVSGIAPIDSFDASPFSTRISGAIKNFDVAPYMELKEAKRFDPFIHYGMAAAIQAIEDSGLVVDESNADRVGAAIGSGIGGINLIEKSRVILDTTGPRKLSPFTVPGAIINMLSGLLSIRYGMRGPNIAITTACTTGTHNIGVAGRMISYGDADVMIVGGAELATSPVGLGGFAAARAMSTRNDDPQAASRPWDRDRDGFVLSDGAGVLVLEELEFAKARGATIYAELLGFGMSADAFHMTSPPEDGNGAARAMQAALNDGGVAPEEVQYINAHGTSTPAGDIAEVRAVKSVFSAAAKKLAISSTKSMHGHLLGAAGAVEAIISILAIRDQLAPPTINLDNPSEECDLNFVPHKAQEIRIERALSNSFGFGGTNGSLLFGKL